MVNCLKNMTKSQENVRNALRLVLSFCRKERIVNVEPNRMKKYQISRKGVVFI